MAKKTIHSSKKQKNKSNKKSNKKVSTTSNGKSKISPWLIVALIATFIAYFSLFQNNYINYDDDIYVTENPLIQNLEVADLFSEFYFSQYSPVAMTLMGLEFKMGNGNPKVIRFFSLLIHLLNVLLVFFIFRRLIGNELSAGLVALLFGVHPLQVESVAWLAASMKIGTYALFFLLSILQYLKYLDEKKKSFLITSVVCFVLSCMCKEQAVALPVLLLAIDYFKKRNVFTAEVIIEKIPYFIIALIFGFITLRAASGGDGKELEQIVYNFGFGERLLFAIYSMVLYVIKLVIPYDISAYYTYPRQGQIPAYFYAFPVLFLALLSSLYYAFKKNISWLAFGILFFLINVGLTALTSIMSVRDVMMADRYVYIPAIGIFFIIVHFALGLQNRISFPAKYLVLGMAGIFTVMSYLRVGDWKNSISLFSDVIEKESYKDKINPYLALPYNNRGVELKRANKLAEAQKDFEMAIRSNQAYAGGYLNRGNIYFNAGQSDKALEDYNKVLSLEPKNDKALSARGAVYAQRGQNELALKDLNLAIAEDKYFLDAISNRGLVYFGMDNFQKAIEDFSQFLKLSPGSADIYEVRGVSYASMGQFANAISDYTKAISLDANNGNFYLNRAKSYNASGKKAQALQDAQKAKSLGLQVGDDFLNSLR